MPSEKFSSPTHSPTKKRQEMYYLVSSREKQRHLYSELIDVALTWIQGIGVPLITTGLALGLKLIFYNTIGGETPFLLFFLPVVLSSWIAGLYSGIIATLLAASATWIFFLPYRLHTPQANFLIFIPVILYVFEGVYTSYFMAQRRKIQQELLLTRNHFNLLIDNLQDYAIIFMDRYGNIADWNRGAMRLFGYKKDEVMGKYFAILFPKEEKGKELPEKEYRTALIKGQSNDENWLQRKNHTTFWGSGVTTPLVDKRSNLHGFVKLVRDATQLQQLEQQRKDFISIASHELKTPVASMQLYTQLLQKYLLTKRGGNVVQYIDKLSDQLNRLKDLMNTLLDVSHIEVGKLMLEKKPLDITQLVDEISATLQPTTKHPLIKKGEITRKVSADKNRIGEVITNLLTNAIKYSPANKKIIVRLVPEKNAAKIIVQDFGVGIPEEQQKKVFDRFFRASNMQNRAPGMGIGLFVAAQIVDAHKGEIGLISKEGKGSTFYFTIPYTG